jgi:pimeloyl-ACP methyl ester carboxylesterase
MPLHRTDQDTEIYYERDGAGREPVVLIAGTGVDHVWWDLQTDLLLKDGRFTLIRPDMRGAGQSTVHKNMSRYSMRVMADDVISLLDHEGIDSAHFIGHSLGSCVAQELGINFPHRTRSLQLHATWARADEWMRRAWIGTTEYPLKLGDKRTAFRTVTMWALSPTYLETRQPESVSSQFARTFIGNPHLQANEGMLGHLTADKSHDSVNRLGQITAPTLVTAGDMDYLIPPRYAEQVASLIRGAHYHLFRGPLSSHAYNWEMMAEYNTEMLNALNAAIRKDGV